MDTLTRTYLALALTPGLGPRKIKLLTEHFGDAEAVYAASERELRAVPGLGPKLVASLLEAKRSERPEGELERAARLGATLIHLAHPDYPEALRSIYDPPPVLFVKGELPQALRGELSEIRSVAIVGTRDASDYALGLSHRLAQGLAQAGVTVVSGLARGVDAAAHRGALSVPSGQTVAVLGSGVDTIYPRENGGLGRAILAGRGALVSEYPVGTGPRPEHFPARNRIISGLARAVLVVEGTHKSGSMITASLALEEGRTVFAVPGRAGDPKAGGTLDLLKQGAVLTQDADDILSELGWSAAKESSGPPLSDAERELVTLIRAQDSPLLDDLIAASGQSATALLPLLTVLELKGAVKAVPGGRYISLR
ncbi:DNA-processing protein DprA [soil metagenome]